MSVTDDGVGDGALLTDWEVDGCLWVSVGFLVLSGAACFLLVLIQLHTLVFGFGSGSPQATT